MGVREREEGGVCEKEWGMWVGVCGRVVGRVEVRWVWCESMCGVCGVRERVCVCERAVWVSVCV